MRHIKISAVVFTLLVLSGCATTSNRAFQMDESQVMLRSMQTRAFDMTDKRKMMQTVISTMQDLDFVIDDADVTIGSVTGTKFINQAVVTMSVTVRPRGETQLLVRANAQVGVTVIKDPETYQDFFNTLGKSLFLTAQQVD
ncbi:MAG: hypothetical protein WC512_02690 [Candidatus Omnitrophota bacterium]